MKCHRDAHGDGYGDPAVTEEQPGTCAKGWVSTGTDCFDGSADVHPGQTSFFATGVKIGARLSFDYDCDGREEEATPAEPHASFPSCDFAGLAHGGCLERGSGYLAVDPPRVGGGVDDFCGSSYIAGRCAGLIGASCDAQGATDTTLRPPIACR